MTSGAWPAPTLFVAKKIEWTEQAKTDIRRIDREIALRLLQGLARFAFTGSGDVKQLSGFDPPQFRLRVGDYRIRFRALGEGIQILRVLHRGEAFR